MIRRGQHDIDDMLIRGEAVLVNGQVHLAVFWKAAVVLGAGILLGLFVPPLGFVLGGAGAVLMAFAALRQHFLLLTLTNKRVLARYGILQVDVVDISLDKIESIELERMLPGYFFGYANVVVMGTGNRYIVIPFVANARQFRKAFNELTLNEELDKGAKDINGAFKSKAQKLKELELE